MSALGHTVAEPVRDDNEHDAFALVSCPWCHGGRTIKSERADGSLVSRSCTECIDLQRRPTGKVLLGNPPDNRYGLTLNYTAGRDVKACL